MARTPQGSGPFVFLVLPTTKEIAMNTIAMQKATAANTGTGLRRGILKPACMSAHSPVYVLLEPPSP